MPTHPPLVRSLAHRHRDESSRARTRASVVDGCCREMICAESLVAHIVRKHFHVQSSMHTLIGVRGMHSAFRLHAPVIQPVVSDWLSAAALVTDGECGTQNTIAEIKLLIHWRLKTVISANS